MGLEELLKTRLKSLYRDTKKTEKILDSNKARLSEVKENLDLLKLFLEEAVNTENLRNMDTGFITKLLQKYHYIDEEKVEEDLKVIKLLLKGIYDKNLKIALNQEQKETIRFYLDSVTKLISELNETKSKILDEYNSINEEENSLLDLILRIELLLEKITDVQDETLLTLEDLDTIKLISEDSSMDVNTRKNILIKYIEYNNDRKNGISKNKNIDIDVVIKCFQEHGKDISKTIKKYSDEVSNHANIKNINDILDYMSSVDLINKFSNADLLAICLFGNVDSVKDEYEEVSKKDNPDFYYDIASVWIDNISNRSIKRKRYRGGREKGEAKEKSLQSVAYGISGKEIDQNIEFLTKEGFVFDLNDVGVRRALTTDHARLEEAVRSLKEHGIVNDQNIASLKLWLVSTSKILEKIDRFIELGLLHGLEENSEYKDYLKRYPSRLHNTDYSEYLLLYKSKQTQEDESYYNTIGSVKRGQLSTDLGNGRLGAVLDSPSKIEEYMLENFVTYSEEINNFNYYEDVINSNFNVEIDEKIYQMNEIASLEQNNRVEGNPFIYVFDGLVISRLKVLRNYSLIKDGTKDALMASIVIGSFLTQESLEKVAKCVNYTLGGNNGLSKKL